MSRLKKYDKLDAISTADKRWGADKSRNMVSPGAPELKNKRLVDLIIHGFVYC